MVVDGRRVDDLEGRPGRLCLLGGVIEQGTAVEQLGVALGDGVVVVHGEQVGVKGRVAVHGEDGPSAGVDGDNGTGAAAEGGSGRLLQADRDRHGDVVGRLVLGEQLAERGRRRVVLAQRREVLGLEPGRRLIDNRVVTGDVRKQAGCGRRVDPQLAIAVARRLGVGEDGVVGAVNVAAGQLPRVRLVLGVVGVVHELARLAHLEVVELQEQHDETDEEHESEPADATVDHSSLTPVRSCS